MGLLEDGLRKRGMESWLRLPLTAELDQSRRAAALFARLDESIERSGALRSHAPSAGDTSGAPAPLASKNGMLALQLQQARMHKDFEITAAHMHLVLSTEPVDTAALFADGMRGFIETSTDSHDRVSITYHAILAVFVSMMWGHTSPLMVDARFACLHMHLDKRAKYLAAGAAAKYAELTSDEVTKARVLNVSFVALESILVKKGAEWGNIDPIAHVLEPLWQALHSKPASERYSKLTTSCWVRVHEMREALPLFVQVLMAMGLPHDDKKETTLPGVIKRTVDILAVNERAADPHVLEALQVNGIKCIKAALIYTGRRYDLLRSGSDFATSPPTVCVDPDCTEEAEWKVAVAGLRQMQSETAAAVAVGQVPLRQQVANLWAHLQSFWSILRGLRLFRTHARCRGMWALAIAWWWPTPL